MEGNFKWSDGSPLVYDLYRDDEPNDLYGQEDCMEIYKDTGKWNDNHCSALRPYICKKTNSKSGSSIYDWLIYWLINFIIIIIFYDDSVT